MRKKIVFVCGSSHSGSTMLDLMLSNNPICFSVGEVSSYFRPNRPHHLNPICGCGIRDCPEWFGIKEQKESRLYETIFDRKPYLSVIIDSSKDLNWINDQARYLKNKSIDLSIILIWKTPIEIAVSLHKRNKLNSLSSIWKRYHKRFLDLIGEFVSIRFSELAMQPRKYVEMLCHLIGVDYIDQQEKYWTRTHHSLFGSAASRIHLHHIESVEYQRLAQYISTWQSENIKSIANPHYRTISYSKPQYTILPVLYQSMIKNDQSLKNLINNIEVRDVVNFTSMQAPTNILKSLIPPRWYFKEKIKYRVSKFKLQRANRSF